MAVNLSRVRAASRVRRVRTWCLAGVLVAAGCGGRSPVSPTSAQSPPLAAVETTSAAVAAPSAVETTTEAASQTPEPPAPSSVMPSLDIACRGTYIQDYADLVVRTNTAAPASVSVSLALNDRVAPSPQTDYTTINDDGHLGFRFPDVQVSEVEQVTVQVAAKAGLVACQATPLQ